LTIAPINETLWTMIRVAVIVECTGTARAWRWLRSGGIH
jgi:hypothetical protein